MTLYDYVALSRTGKKVKGRVDASSEKEARERLREQSLLVSSLALSKAGRRDRLSGENMVTFTRLLAQLVDSGVPLFESLQALEEQYRGERFHPILTALCDQIKGGNSLSEAMAQHPHSFDRLYCAMVEAGESSGALGSVLQNLANYLEKQQKLKGQILTAMIYPAVLALFSLLVIALLLLFVVPSIESVFEGRELNSFSNFVIGVSHAARKHGWWFVPLVGAAIGYGTWWSQTSKGQAAWQRFSLKLPLIKGVTTQASMARLCRTLSTLVQGGVPLVEALRIGQGVMGNVVLEEEIARAEKHVIEGSSLSVELERSEWIPPMVARMVAVGEDTGTANVMFARIAELYESQLDKTLARVMALAQPVILIVMGLFIGSILLAILLPLTDVSQLTG